MKSRMRHLAFMMLTGWGPKFPRDTLSSFSEHDDLSASSPSSLTTFNTGKINVNNIILEPGALLETELALVVYSSCRVYRWVILERLTVFSQIKILRCPGHQDDTPESSAQIFNICISSYKSKHQCHELVWRDNMARENPNVRTNDLPYLIGVWFNGWVLLKWPERGSD